MSIYLSVTKSIEPSISRSKFQPPSQQEKHKKTEMSADRWRDEGGPWEEAAPTNNVDVRAGLRVGLGVPDVDDSPVCVCVRVCVCLCVCVDVFSLTLERKQARTHARTHTQTHTYIHTPTLNTHLINAHKPEKAPREVPKDSLDSNLRSLSRCAQAAGAV